MPRVASEGLRIAGKSVAPGQVAVVAFGLVNRDPSAFDNPDVLALTRHPNHHLSFGYGIHHCLGAYLARMELDIALNTLLQSIPTMTLGIDERQLKWSASHTIRRLLSLPVTWDP